MKDFQLRNDTKLLFRNDPAYDLKKLSKGKKTLFVYGGGSALKNGCYEDVKTAVSAGGKFYEFGHASRELADIEKGIRLVKENGIELVIGAGGASIMDCAKLIAFGAYHADDLWEYVKAEKSPYGLEKLPLILMPTYPSSGSEYGLGAVSADARTNDFGTAYGVSADTAILVPKYSLSLSSEMTAYTGLVTLVQLSASIIGDRNPVSYDAGISVIRNVLKAVKQLHDDPNNLDARGTILADIRRYFSDAFEYEGIVPESVDKITELFAGLGIDMYFDNELQIDNISQIPIETMLTQDEVADMIKDCMRIDA